MCCSNPCWLEQLAENCDDTAAAIEDQSYRMNRAFAQKVRNFTEGLNSDSTDECQCEACQAASGQYIGEAYSEASGQSDNHQCDNQQCSVASEPAAPNAHYKQNGLRASRNVIPREKKIRQCKRCRQTPCRCGYCEGCDGFERADATSSSASNQTDPNCAVPAAKTGGPTGFLPLPVPPDEGPTPIKPPTSSGPTPIRPNPPDKPAPPPAPADESAAIEEEPKLEPVDFEELERPQKREGWQPVHGSKPAR